MSAKVLRKCSVSSLILLWQPKSAQSALSSMVFKIQAFLCFEIFAKNSKIQNGRYIWRDENILKIGMGTLQRYPAVKNFVEFAPSSTVFEIQAFLCCAKTSKIQNRHHFW